MELNTAYLFGKPSRASARATVCDYKPESLAELTQ